MKKLEVISQLSHLKTHFINATLLSAVEREEKMNSDVGKKIGGPEVLKNIARGSAFIIYFAFLENNIGKGLFEKLSKEEFRKNLPAIDWISFDIAKFIRNRAAHSFSMEIMDKNESPGDIKRRNVMMLKISEASFPGLNVCNGKIEITDQSVHECLRSVWKIVEAVLVSN